MLPTACIAIGSVLVVEILAQYQNNLKLCQKNVRIKHSMSRVKLSCLTSTLNLE